MVPSSPVSFLTGIIWTQTGRQSGCILGRLLVLDLHLPVSCTSGSSPTEGLSLHTQLLGQRTFQYSSLGSKTGVCSCCSGAHLHFRWTPWQSTVTGLLSSGSHYTATFGLSLIYALTLLLPWIVQDLLWSICSVPQSVGILLVEFIVFSVRSPHIYSYARCGPSFLITLVSQRIQNT